MYRSNSDPTKKKSNESLTNLFGCNGLNMKCLQEMCLDSCPPEAADQPKHSPSNSPTLSSCDSANTSSDSGVGMAFENLLAKQHQQILATHQQQLTAAALAKHQLAMAIAAGNHHNNNFFYISGESPAGTQQDEISKSLKMFAMLTAYSNVTEPFAYTPQLPVDAVMQDFACNGYVCDDLSRFQLGMHLPNNLTSSNDSTINHSNSSNDQHFNKRITSNGKHAANLPLSQQHVTPFQQQHFNINFSNNFWKTVPNHVQQHSNAVTAAAAATAAARATAAANIHYNNNQKKVNKRYNTGKNEKYSSAKHCVFCENNNEPEAVVKSHAVRDALNRVLCPKLRTYVCPICQASGDTAHTVKYCPQKPIITMEDAVKAESFRLAKDSYYKQQMKA